MKASDPRKASSPSRTLPVMRYQASAERGIVLDKSVEELAELAADLAVRKMKAEERLKPIQDYYESLDELSRAKKEGRYDEAYEIAWKGVQNLPSLVDETVKAFGQWDIKSSPYLDFVCRHLAVTRNRAQIRKVENILKSREGLKQWLDSVDLALKDCDLIDILLRHIEANPGVKQRSLGKNLHVDGRRASTLLRDAEQRGIVRREKESTTYRLYLP